MFTKFIFKLKQYQFTFNELTFILLFFITRVIIVSNFKNNLVIVNTKLFIFFYLPKMNFNLVFRLTKNIATLKNTAMFICIYSNDTVFF